jgi:succinate dehydrogenase / fumarate reductase, cytochrome b subunit
MNSTFLRFSSITKKIWMAFLGLFLMIFLVVHLSINLCLLRDDGGAWFNAAAHFMGTNYIVKVFEVGLFGGIFLHILIGSILQVQNWMARPTRYMVTNKTTTPAMSKYRIYTGGLVLIFMIIHFMNFYFIKIGWVSNPNVSADGEPDFYIIAQQLFAIPAYSILYIVMFVALGLHLNHSFQSALQSLGINIPRYDTCIRRFGTFYAIVVPLGFIIIPIYFLLIR